MMGREHIAFSLRFGSQAHVCWKSVRTHDCLGQTLLVIRIPIWAPIQNRGWLFAFALLCFALLGLLACLECLLACLPACLRACVRAFVCACMLACMRACTHACVSCVCVRVDLTCFALLGFAFVEFLRSSVLASLLLLRGCSFVSLVLSSMPSLSLPPSPPSPHPAPTPLLAIPGRSP